MTGRIVRKPWCQISPPIEGEAVTLRTLHPPHRGRGMQRDERPPFTLDGLVTITIPVVRACADAPIIVSRIVRW